MDLTPDLQQKVVTYTPSPDLLQPIVHAPLLVLVGISGAGKNVVIDQLLAKYASSYGLVVSHVTRSPRPAESEGKPYHFISLVKAEKLIEEKAYIEVDVYAQQIYGTTIEAVQEIYRQEKIGLTDMTTAGADHYLSLGLNAKAVFLLPPSYSVWRERFGGRKDNIQPNERRQRLKTALHELQHALANPNYYLVINDNLNRTVFQVDAIGKGQVVQRHPAEAESIASDIAQNIRAELEL